MTTMSYSPRTGFSALRSRTSRPILLISCTSAATRSWLPGTIAKPPGSTGCSAAASSQSPSSTSVIEYCRLRLSMPQPIVALP